MARFIDDCFNAYFEWNPSSATAVGFHQYDNELEDYSATAFEKRIEKLKQLQGRLASLPPERTPDDAIDIEILDGQIRAELLDLETLQTWRKNPMTYVSLPGGAIDNLMKRNFAPAADRLRSVVARLKGVPPMIAAMKQNIDDPPHEFSDLAFRIARGSVGFFKESVANWAKDAAGNDTSLLQEFNTANDTAANSIEDAAGWLEKTLLPKSKGAYAIGADNFSKKLLYEEMVDTPLERILAIGEENLEKDYNAFLETARKIDPSKKPADVMKSLSNQHPTEASLIPDAKKTVEGIIQFIRENKIITIPSEVRPTITETPPYARSGSFASMDTPGPYETKATEAFYYVTPPEKDWDARHKEEHLRAYNPPVMNIITIHEAYPGHYIQFLNAKQFPTKTRKLISCGTNAEGWAHYSEQMMLEEGFGNADPRTRLAQLEEALLRDARYVVGIKLHTAGWTVEQGAKFFEEKAFQEPANAYEEARRGAYNPTYLYYTLGKLQIYKLREDYRKAHGSSYTLQGFHDQFVKQGSIPIKLIRRILLPGDTGPTL
ncbi:MAG TPA: DUF885 domain-containing protein [Terriglobia bacterium]|nr:DUF885 domain-containing protein [Terriglobia bacterium]